VSYKRKIVIYGKIARVFEYERAVSTGVSRKQRSRKRVCDLWKGRRRDNVFALKRKFVQRVHASFEKCGQPLFVTVTTSAQGSNITNGYKAIRSFFLRLRKVYPDFEAIGVPEFHKSGALHHHLLLFGLPNTLGDVRRGRITLAIGDERKTRQLAKLWKMGFLDCRRMNPNYGADDIARVAYYLAKYMVKGSGDLRLRGRRSFISLAGYQKLCPIMMI